MKTNTQKAAKQPKERISLFLESGSIQAATVVAECQSAANPNRDKVLLSSVLREAVSIGLAQLHARHIGNRLD